MKLLYEKIIPPKTGLAVEVRKGQLFRVIDLEGKQVVDTILLNLNNPREKLSTSYSRSRFVPKPGEPYSPHDHIEEGDVLMSTIQNPMATFIKETMEIKGMHDVHMRCCNRGWYELYGQEPRDGCLEILGQVIAPYGLLREDVPDTLDLFENYRHDCNTGRWILGEPTSRPGDYVEFRAEMDLVLAMSNCPDDVVSDVNARHCTPIKVEVYEPE